MNQFNPAMNQPSMNCPDSSAEMTQKSEQEETRLIWKLKGTGKKSRRAVISECVKGQPVFIICDSNGSNCTVITEEGEEIGRLSEHDSKTYHNFVEKRRAKIYIKKIREDEDKPRVKILLIVQERRSDT